MVDYIGVCVVLQLLFGRIRFLKPVILGVMSCVCKVHVATENVRFVPLALCLHIALLCWTQPARVTHVPTWKIECPMKEGREGEKRERGRRGRGGKGGKKLLLSHQ